MDDLIRLVAKVMLQQQPPPPKLVYHNAGLACDDCMLVIANGNYADLETRQAEATREGINRIGKYLVVGEEHGFSWRRCAICGGLAGNRHEVGYLA